MDDTVEVAEVRTDTHTVRNTTLLYCLESRVY